MSLPQRQHEGVSNIARVLLQTFAGTLSLTSVLVSSPSATKGASQQTGTTKKRNRKKNLQTFHGFTDAGLVTDPIRVSVGSTSNGFDRGLHGGDEDHMLGRHFVQWHQQTSKDVPGASKKNLVLEVPS